jgi:glycosyltransferase involved in cell wall biosynthesis/predicted ATP-grasp superfamily ATP-dependent carboligase
MISAPALVAPPSLARERVLVLDAHTNQALACARSLGRAGHEVFVASHRLWPLAAWSTYSRGRFRLAGESVEAFAELRAWAGERGVTVVLPLTERACLLCNAERHAWEALGIVVGCGPDEMLLRAFDKAETARYATASGAMLPPTKAPRSLAECRAAAQAVGFPCVVKPRFSNVHDGFVFQPGESARYVGHPDQLDAAIEATRQGDRWPLIQGFVPGAGKGVFALCNHGEAVAWFAHERLRDVRPSGSGSSLRRAIALDPRLRAPAERLLRQMQWHGPAMVEFRDDGVNAPYLIEVNGRFWGSLQLAVSAGVDFPHLWLALLRNHRLPPSRGYVEGVTLRWLWGDVKRFLYILAGAPRGYPGPYPSVWQGVRELLGPQPRGTLNETWTAGDRWPVLGEVVQGVRELVIRLLRRGAPPLPAPVSMDASHALRVLMLTPDWPTPDRPRTTNFIKRQAEALRAAGAHIDVFHFAAEQRLWNYLRAWRAVRRRLATGRYDLVHAQFGQSGLVALPKRVPLVVTFRGSDLLGIVSDKTGRHTWRGRVAQRCSRMVARLADAVIVVSEHMKAQLPAAVRPTVIPSGLDLKLFHPIPRDEARRRLGWSPGRRVVLFVGRPFQARKRHSLARDAVALLNRSLPAELVVAWGVPHTEMPVYMSAADVLVCTSMQEGSPNVVKEALACDLPVVSVPVGDVALRLQGVAGCELCADERPETIAAALERVLRRDQRIDGRDAVRPLDEELLTQQVLDIYRSVVNGHALDRRGLGKGRLTVRKASPSEELEWDTLVQRFDHCRIAHTRAWLRSLEASGCGQPLYLVFERDHEIVGCLPGLLVRFGPLRLFGSPLPGWQTVSMGPVFDERRVSAADLVATLVPFLRHRYGIHHIELMCSHLDPAAMQAAGFRGDAVTTYRAPLAADEATTMKAMKDSTRRNVRRAIKLGLVTRFETEESFVDEHYSQIKEVYARRGFSVPFGKRRVLEFFRHMKAAGSLLAIAVYLEDEGPCIATGMFTVHGRELLLSMWTHRTRYRWYRPTELMTWTVMQKAMALGCDNFDLMGRGDFKAKFGATPDASKRRWVWSRYAWLTAARDLAEKGYRWQQGIRGRLARLTSTSLPPSPVEAGQVEDEQPARSPSRVPVETTHA